MLFAVELGWVHALTVTGMSAPEIERTNLIGLVPTSQDKGGIAQLSAFSPAVWDCVDNFGVDSNEVSLNPRQAS